MFELFKSVAAAFGGRLSEAKNRLYILCSICFYAKN